MGVFCEEWGKLSDGKSVQLYTLTNAAGSSVSVATYGGIITSILTPDSTGKIGDIVLGYDTIEEYVADDAYMGAMIGRYANRIADGQFELNGQNFQLTKNQNGNTLHGGTGFNKRLWKAAVSDNSLLLQYYSPDGEDGFPGNLDVSVRYNLSDDNCLTLDMTAVSDQDTVCCLTNHSYFNLAGHGNVFSHVFRIEAEEYTPLQTNKIPDGSIRPVNGTIYDFQEEKSIPDKNFDANFVMIKSGLCAAVREASVGRCMQIYSDMPAIQFYAGGGLSTRQGKRGQIYGPNSGFCLEPQYYPNSPNEPCFPTSVLKKGRPYHHTIRYHFFTEAR